MAPARRTSESGGLAGRVPAEPAVDDSNREYHDLPVDLR
jgi:hypothetical protein